MRLLHLTAVAADIEPATLEFAPRLTVIYGASETGKSYVIDCLDYMFGARALRDIPQAAAYKTLLLGIDTEDGRTITLARDLRQGNRVSVYYEDLRSWPSSLPDRDLLAQHSKTNPENISHFLLDELDLSGAVLRKNQRNTLQALSFRNLAHLCLISEERMQSRIPPLETGLPTARTAELSTFKLLVEGKDDSALLTGEDPVEFRKVNQGQLDVLDRAIAQLTDQLWDEPDRVEILDELAGVNTMFALLSTSVGEHLRVLDGLMSSRAELQDGLRGERRRLAEATVLSERFRLLDAQYESDLDRLQVVRDAGNFLGYFGSGPCVFCGASPEDQRVDHAVYETAELSQSVDAEASRTTALKQDLALTIGEMDQQRESAASAVSELESGVANVSLEIAALEERTLPVRQNLATLLDRRSELEKSIGLRDRVADLERLRLSIAGAQPEAVDAAGHGISVGTQQRFSSVLKRVLSSWRVPESGTAFFNLDSARPDVSVDQRLRGDRGKGMRSILHAGFSVALSEFCAESALPHPGFLALDTPVLTYRDAEKGLESREQDGDELLSESVAGAFYAYLTEEHSGQAIVLENQTPPNLEADGVGVIFFSGAPGIGRSGFYPQ